MASPLASLPLLVNSHYHLGLSTTIPPLATTLVALLLPPLFVLYILTDYRAFLSLGPGGTPSTPLGYLKIKLLSLICLRDPLRPSPVPPHFRPQIGYLSRYGLEKRSGIRPVVRGIAPQRQQTQTSSPTVYKALVAALRSLANDKANALDERTSCFEKHSSGLFTTSPIVRTCGGEICHAHPSDGSLHLTLHPADAALVLDAGWGERHPLARGGWCRRFVPKEFVLIYAPRNQAEVAVVMRIVAASVWWVSGIDVSDAVNGRGERRRSADVIALGVALQGKGDECWACKVHGCGAGVGVDTLRGDA